jgi:acyl carrier protein
MQEEIINYITFHLLGNQADLELAADEDLLGSGLVDSIGMMQLIHFIEERAGIRIPLGDVTIENFMTIEAIDDYVRRMRNHDA